MVGEYIRLTTYLDTCFLASNECDPHAVLQCTTFYGTDAVDFCISFLSVPPSTLLWVEYSYHLLIFYFPSGRTYDLGDIALP